MNSLNELKQQIETEILTIGGQVGVYFEDLRDGEIVQVNENVLFPSASVVKIPIMIQVMKLAASGTLDLQSMVNLDLSLPEYRQCDGSGVFQAFCLKLNGLQNIEVTQLPVEAVFETGLQS